MSGTDTAAAIADSKRSTQRLAVGGLALSGLSYALVAYAAGAEPFIVFRWSDLVLNVGLGTVLFALFAACCVACLRNYRNAPRRRTIAKGLLGVSVVWAALNLFYLGATIYGYAQDMNNPVLSALR